MSLWLQLSLILFSHCKFIACVKILVFLISAVVTNKTIHSSFKK